MAFTTTFIISATGAPSNAYNIDFSVGAGVRGNHPVDIMLVQALFRIAHFELKNPLRPPPGETSIGIDGKLTPQTLRFILHLQQHAKSSGIAVRLDGICDPFRAQGQLSLIAKVRYVLELLNNSCFRLCRDEGLTNFVQLPSRDDIPAALIGELNQPKRAVARQYQR